MERSLPRGPLWVILKFRTQNVFDIFGVARDSVEPLFECEEGEEDGGGLVGGGGGGGGEVSSNPVMEAVAVEEEEREGADKGVHGWAGELAGDAVVPN